MHLDPKLRNLDYVPYYERLIKTYNQLEVHIVSGLFECYVASCTNFIIGKISDTVTSTSMKTVISITLLNQTR